MDSFLYGRDLRHERVKKDPVTINSFKIVQRQETPKKEVISKQFLEPFLNIGFKVFKSFFLHHLNPNKASLFEGSFLYYTDFLLTERSQSKQGKTK